MASSVSNLYIHKRLSSNDSIRILHLHPAHRLNAPVHCELEEVCLDAENQPKYDALSYVWGSTVGTWPILCEGMTLYVTENCRDALVYLRRRTRKMTLWIDAICINQTDDMERSRQVRMMGRVYSNAQQVHVWLGVGDRPDWAFVKVLRRAHRLCVLLDLPYRVAYVLEDFKGRMMTNPFATQYFGRLYSRLDDCLGYMRQWVVSRTIGHAVLRRRPTNQGRLIDGVDFLMDNEWFSRVWTFQEISFSRSARIHVGKSYIDWDGLDPLVYEISGRNEGLNNFIQGFNSGLTASSVRARFSARTLLTTRSPSKDPYQQIQILQVIGRLKSKEAVDKFFGVYAVLEAIGLKLPEPDYASSFRTISETVTRAYINSHRSLCVLSLAIRQPSSRLAQRESTVESLPTWVPDWNEPFVSDGHIQRFTDGWNQIQFLRKYLDRQRFYLYPGFQAAGSSEFRSFVEDGQPASILTVRGLAIGDITQLGSALQKECSNSGVEASTVPPERNTQIQCWWRLVDELPRSSNAGSNYAAAFYATISFYATYARLTDSLNFNQDPPKSEFLVDRSFLEWFRVLCYPDCKLRVAQSAHAQCSQSELESVKIIVDLLRDRLKIPRVGTPTSTSKVLHVQTVAGNLLQELNLFLLDSGYMGMAHSIFQVDDVVYLLEGSRFPVILRPREDGTFEFVTLAYVHGVMLGEAWPEDEGVLEVLRLV